MRNSVPATQHWLSVHERIGARARRGVLLLATLAAIAGIDAFAELRHRQEEYLFTREFVRKLDSHNEGAQRLFLERCLVQVCSDLKLVANVDEIPGVGLDYNLFIAQNHPERELRILDYEVPLAAFTLALTVGPLFVLLLIYARVQAMARIASLIRNDAADSGEIQQRLNSVFSDRATRELGERRHLYSIVWAVVLWALALAPQLLFLAGRAQIKTNRQVVIDIWGTIRMAPVEDTTSFTQLSEFVLLEFAFYVIAVAVIAYLIGRSLSRQLEGSGAGRFPGMQKKAGKRTRASPKNSQKTKR